MPKAPKSPIKDFFGNDAPKDDSHLNARDRTIFNYFENAEKAFKKFQEKPVVPKDVWVCSFYIIRDNIVQLTFDGKYHIGFNDLKWARTLLAFAKGEKGVLSVRSRFRGRLRTKYFVLSGVFMSAYLVWVVEQLREYWSEMKTLSKVMDGVREPKVPKTPDLAPDVPQPIKRNCFFPMTSKMSQDMEDSDSEPETPVT